MSTVERLPPDWVVPDWPAPPNVRAFITARSGGVSQGPYGGPQGLAGMNIGLGSGESVDVVEHNRMLLQRYLPAAPAWLKMVHGADVVDAESSQGAVADASTALEPDVVCVVTVADCLPVLFADAHGRAVGVAHAGWRGLAAGVLQNTVRAMRRRLDDPQARIVAYLGPAIGPARFEVGEDVLAAMRARLPEAGRAFKPTAPGKYLADLFTLARQALAQVDVADVHGGQLCTATDPDRFYSYRRDRVTGRHAALIWRKGGVSPATP